MTDSAPGVPDSALISSDRKQFAALFDRHAATLHRYCARRVAVAAAEDVVAETFLIAFEKRDRFDTSHTSALPWLYRIATNLLRRHRREEARALRALARTGIDPLARPGGTDDSVERIADRIDASVASRELAAALAAMPVRHRDTLLLYAWGQLSYAEIATALGISPGTVRSRLSRAKARLRAELTPPTPATTVGERA